MNKKCKCSPELSTQQPKPVKNMETTQSLKFFLEYLGEGIKNRINPTFFDYSGYSVHIHPDPEDDSELGTLVSVAYPKDTSDEDIAWHNKEEILDWVTAKIKERYGLSMDAGLKTPDSWVYITQEAPCNLFAVQLKDSSIHITISLQA